MVHPVVERVSRRFGEQFAISHSGLSNRQRYLAWEKFRAGDVNIMLGTRSCLFSQSDRLGLIIIDEEHPSTGLVDVSVPGFFDGLISTILEAYHFLENR